MSNFSESQRITRSSNPFQLPFYDGLSALAWSFEFLFPHRQTRFQFRIVQPDLTESRSVDKNINFHEHRTSLTSLRAAMFANNVNAACLIAAI